MSQVTIAMVTWDVGTAAIGCPRSAAPPGVARGGIFNSAVNLSDRLEHCWNLDHFRIGKEDLVSKARQLFMKKDPASPSTVAALEDDPFYRSICAPYDADTARRRPVLAEYFDYSIQEGRELGRCVHLADEARGVAVWLLPQPPEIESRAAQQKRTFLQATLSAEGFANYHRIIEFMSAKSAALIDEAAWYLSIVAVDPAVQGKGLGRKLLEPTIAEADRAGVTCYLETFSPRSLPFYQRLGFAPAARFTEPTTGADYTVMVRHFGEKG
jgi:GNAT superfamily N-acetyltransferase